MFEKLKQWTLRALDCVPLAPGCSPDLRANMSTAPLVQQGEACWCYNCRVLREVVGECPICLEPFPGVCLCEACSNPVCPRCAARLTACPFCRHPRAPAPHPALDRLLAKLRLPIPMSEKKSRECPVGEECGWEGEDIASHLEAVHRMSLLEGTGLTLEIGGFRRKARSCRRYAVALSCYGRVFVAQVGLAGGRLALGVTSRPSPPTHGAWLELSSPSRTVKAILPVAIPGGKPKRLEVSSESLMTPWRHGSDDTVRISVTIRPLS